MSFLIPLNLRESFPPSSASLLKALSFLYPANRNKKCPSTVSRTGVFRVVHFLVSGAIPVLALLERMSYCSIAIAAKLDMSLFSCSSRPFFRSNSRSYFKTTIAKNT